MVGLSLGPYCDRQLIDHPSALVEGHKSHGARNMNAEARLLLEVGYPLCYAESGGRIYWEARMPMSMNL